MTDNNAGEVLFSTRLLAGAHAFTGASLQIKGAGTLSFVKPAAAPGSPDLQLTKTGLTNGGARPDDDVHAGVPERWRAAHANAATGVQLTDVLPPVTYATYVPGGQLLRVHVRLALEHAVLGAGDDRRRLAACDEDLPGHSYLLQPRAFSPTFSNDSKILSAENDTNLADNVSKVTTTIVVPGISGTMLDDQDGDGVDDGGAGAGRRDGQAVSRLE